MESPPDRELDSLQEQQATMVQAMKEITPKPVLDALRMVQNGPAMDPPRMETTASTKGTTNA